MSTSNFTTEQLLSLRTDRHISVTANAGSGKTMVLVERFKKIIHENILNHESSYVNPLRIDPSRILAITFTRKAAGEMHKKIINKFDEEYNELVNSIGKHTVRLNDLKRIREGLTYSNISTIHGFCSSLLRNYPVEANVQVNFSELTASDNIYLLKNCFLSTLEDWLFDESDSLKNVKIKQILSYHTKDNLLQLVSSVIEKAEIYSSVNEFYQKTDDVIIEENLRAILDILYYKELSGKINRLINLLNKDDLFTSKSGKSYEDIAALLPIGIEFLEYYDYNDLSNLVENLDELSIILSALYTKELTLKKAVLKLLNSEETTLFLEEFSTYLKRIQQLKDAIDSFEHAHRSLSLTRLIWEFINEVYILFEQEKNEESKLDFNDLQLKTLRLLQNSEVASKVRSKFDFIMIDEFQDTNDLQYEIIKQLVPELTDPTLNTGINLFIVGDVKQSIYGFRNADVRVFTKAIQDITSINKLKVETDEISSMPLESMNYDRDYEESEFLGKNRLTSTFRLLAIPAAFTNFVFRNLMNNSKSEFEVMYEDLICSRNIEKLQIANGRIIADDECGKIVFLISEKTPSDTDSENFGAESTNSNDEDITDLTEELNIASYIQSIIGSKLFSSKDGNLIDYKDIAVLSHKTTNFSKLSKVLHQSKIPHIFNGGQGFYKTSEVDDLLTFLRFIYNPNDDISFVALMRSPYMNFSDSEILKIRKYNLSRTLWDNFSELAKVELWDKVRKFYKMLNGIRNYSVSQTIPTVIYKIIETFGLSGKNVIESSYEQRTANINKFMDMARNFESQGFKNLIDFVDEVNFISENSIRESEAPVISDDNVVNILTIHGSKGLQFPVVILYNTNSASGNDSYMQVSQHFGISFKLNLANDMNYENKNITPFSFINKLIHDQMIEAEAKRVLYVAMTRAEEILVISALLDTNKEGGFKKTKSYLRLILEGMQLDADKLINLNVLKTELGLRLNDRIQNFKIEFNPEIITTFIKSINTKIKEQSTVPLNLNSNVNSKQMNELFSASKFMTYQNDSEEYLFRYLLGFLDDDNEPINDGLRQSDDEPIGVFPGKIIHAVMEKIKLCTDEMGSVNEDNLRRIISSITLSDAFGELNKLNNRVLSECKAVTETKLIRSELENLKSAEFEKTMLMPVGDNFINSIVDVFFTNSKKEIEIWDWKTNLVNSISETKVLAEKYRIQMKIYAYLASKYEPEQMSFKTRLLFTRLAKQNIDDEKWTYEFTWSRAELEEFEQSLKGQISEMRDKLYFWL